MNPNHCIRRAELATLYGTTLASSCIVRHSPFVLIPGLLLLGALTACSSERGDDSTAPDGDTTQPPATSSTSEAPTPTPKDGEEPSTDGGESSAAQTEPPCDDKQTAAIQTAFDGAHPTDTNAVLFVKSACGGRFFSSGPGKVDATKLHRIASVTKSYTGSLILKLVEDGLLLLDDPVSKWLPAIPGGDAVHVRHLLQHTSGLAPYDTDWRHLGSQATKSKWTGAQLVTVSFSHPLRFTPGSKYEYSNINFTTLGLIAEIVTGKHYASLIRTRILEPIGAKATFVDGDEPVIGEITPGRNDLPFGDPSSFWAAANIVATPSDVATWFETLASGKFHNAANNMELLDGGAWTGYEGYFYSAGLVRMDESKTGVPGSGPAYTHNGDVPGYHTTALYYPKSKTTVVFTIDADPANLLAPIGPAVLPIVLDGH